MASLMKAYTKYPSDITEAVQWSGHNIHKVYTLLNGSTMVSINAVPQGSLVIRIATGDKVCPLKHYIIKEGSVYHIMHPELFQSMYKEVE